MKRNFDKEDEGRLKRWRRNGFDLEAEKGRRSPQGLGFLKGACSLQGRCSLSASLLCLALCMSSSSSPTTPATQDQLWLTSALVQNSFKLLDLWENMSSPNLHTSPPPTFLLLDPIVSPIWDHAWVWVWVPEGSILSLKSLQHVEHCYLKTTCALVFARLSEGAMLVWQKRKRDFSHCNVVLYGVLCRAVNWSLELKELLQACCLL